MNQSRFRPIVSAEETAAVLDVAHLIFDVARASDLRAMAARICPEEGCPEGVEKQMAGLFVRLAGIKMKEGRP